MITSTSPLGIDISKRKFDACLVREGGKLRHKVFPNSPDGFSQLSAWLSKQKVERAHACLEATGTYGEALATYLHESGHEVSVVNPAQIKAYAQSRLSRAKTDKADATLIAQFCAERRPPAWSPLPREVRELQALARRLDSLVEMRQMEANRLEVDATEAVRESLAEHLTYLGEEIARTQELIRSHIDSHPGLRGQRDLLLSIPGGGATTAAKLLAEIMGEALGKHWQGIGERPNAEGLDERTAAEVLLQAGALSGWIGASGQSAGAQEQAKDLISESAALFERLGESDRAAAARSDLALCYWREGAYDNARVLLEQAASLIGGDAELKAKTVLRLVVVESSSGRYSDALRLLTDSTPLFEESTSHALKGIFHNERALVLRKLATAERRQDYFDRAIIEHTAAVYHFEQAGHQRYVARTENNLASPLYKLGRYGEAHEHLDRARLIFTRLNDAGSLAQVDETRARVLVAEQRYREANRVLAGAIQTLEKGGESALLADALTVQGVVWARLEIHESSLTILRRAVEVAEVSGALCSAGRAALTLIEEHGARHLSLTNAHKLYLRADELLRDTQDAEDIARLRACARVVIGRLAGGRLHEEGFTFHGAGGSPGFTVIRVKTNSTNYSRRPKSLLTGR